MPHPTNEDGLTLKQDRFVNAYIETNGNGLRSAEKAGYRGEYSTLGAIASENLTKPKVQAAIARKVKAAVDEAEIMAELSEVARLKFDKKDYKPDHKLKALQFTADILGMFKANQNTVNISLNHWQGVVEAQSLRTGRSIEQETRIALSLPEGIIPEDVRVELAKRLNAKENPE